MRIAPFVVLGAMFFIAFTGLSVIFIHECNRKDPYMDPTEMAPKDPNRLDHVHNNYPGSDTTPRAVKPRARAPRKPQ